MKQLLKNQRGSAHYVLPLVVALLVGVVGVKILAASHADTPTARVELSSNKLFTREHSIILNTNQVASGPTIAASSVPYSYIGTQPVAVLSPGQSLSYTQGVKGDETSCYLVYVTQPKTGTSVANVSFANNNNSVVVKLASTPDNNLQKVCVPPGKSTNPGYAVKNVTSLQQNIAVEVYQDIISWE